MTPRARREGPGGLQVTVVSRTTPAVRVPGLRAWLASI